MATYAALLRGISPTDPNMRNEKLRGVFEGLGLLNVRTVISSGNVIFESGSKDIPALERKIEKALMNRLGIKSPAYIRSETELRRLMKKDPFKGAGHAPKTYLIVSFIRKKPREICGIVDLTDSKTPQFMRDIERRFGKDVTTRTWKTVGRIIEKMDR